VVCYKYLYKHDYHMMLAAVDIISLKTIP
jgi:hypothetical protein